MNDLQKIMANQITVATWARRVALILFIICTVNLGATAAILSILLSMCEK